MSLEHSPATSRRRRARPPKQPLEDRYLDREQASELLGIPVDTLLHDVVHRRLGVPYYKFGRRVRYRESELHAWAAARRVAPDPEICRDCGAGFLHEGPDAPPSRCPACRAAQP